MVLDRKYRGFSSADDLSVLTGLAFEDYLSQLFAEFGIAVEKTPASGDYGADLIIDMPGSKVVAQAKQYSGMVGFDAVKEIYFARDYYHADEAWVITTSGFTSQAISAAEETGVKLIDGDKLTAIIHEMRSGKRVRPQREWEPIIKRYPGENVLVQARGAGEEIVLPDGIDAVGGGAFSEDGVIGMWVKEIGSVGWFKKSGDTGLEPPFFHGDTLRSVCIPEGVVWIGHSAFLKCHALCQVGLPKSLKLVGDYTFSWCGFRELTVPAFVQFGYGAFGMNGDLKRVEFDEGVSVVWRAMFMYCQSLSHIAIPYGVEVIESQAFQGCSSLRHLTLPSSLKLLAVNAFAGCPVLKSGELLNAIENSGAEIELLYDDGTIVPKDKVADVLEQERFFSANLGAMQALDRCIMFERSKEDLRKIVSELADRNIEDDKIVKELGQQRDAAISELKKERLKKIQDAKEQLNRLLVTAKKKRMVAEEIERLNKSFEDSLNQVDLLYETRSEPYLCEIKKREAAACWLESFLHSSACMVRDDIAWYGFPIKWIEMGRIRPASLIGELDSYFYEKNDVPSNDCTVIWEKARNNGLRILDDWVFELRA